MKNNDLRCHSFFLIQYGVNDVALCANSVVLRTNDVASPTMLPFVQMYAIMSVANS
jgi:hypothetical protein